MIVINTSLLDETTEKAKQSPRLRTNHNFHTSLEAPLHRLLNAMEPGTYIRPHRHLHPSKDEIFLLLRGEAVLFLFDDEGTITDHIRLNPAEGVYGAEVEAGTWHCLLVLASGTVVYEVKEGPFVPLEADNLAPWSPEASDREESKKYMDSLQKIIP